MNVRSTTIQHPRLTNDATVPVGKIVPVTAFAANAADLRARADAVAAVAAKHAMTVDHDARFPAEAIASARSERLLGIMVPHELGGEGAGISDVAEVCYVLGRACASTAMIYAMHQTKIACITRHARDSAWHQRLLRRIDAEQLLMASSTTEGSAGGDVRKSAAPVEQEGSRISLTRDATVISYGAEADGVVTTARRSPEASASDQVLVVFLKEDYSLERIIGWDTLGMRGTCSAGFKLKATGEPDQVLPDPYEGIHVQTMMPVAHLTWSSAWTGVAAGAVERARLFVREAARRAGGQLPPGATHLTRASATLRTLRALVASSLARFEAVSQDERALETVDFQTAMNLLKVNASELAIATVMSSLQACGLSGYRNDGDFSVGRHLRDVLSSPIMINNDRILANVANASLLTGVPTTLRD
ncbi:MAG: acyl-CoA dehydrogenase [Alphaproteobacteria bacterium]|jgi:acyl-CoA dehydrogenase|nr:acyl-CoA dehydrogenase [Alphaproteobacteria bacterium]MEA2990145.1 acyl-CoA dehydrogenase [Alphaproteobacteria bacterium]